MLEYQTYVDLGGGGGEGETLGGFGRRLPLNCLSVCIVIVVASIAAATNVVFVALMTGNCMR